MRIQHPAVQVVLDGRESGPREDDLDATHTTSLSLARALAVGCLSGLDPSLTSVNVWDPATGSGLAGFMLADALESAGVQVRYRGQDISDAAVSASRRRFETIADAEVALQNTL